MHCHRNSDPIGYEDQINLYAYVWNDPTNMRDPAGTDGKDLWTSVVDWARRGWSSVKIEARRLPKDLADLPGHALNGTTGLPPRSAEEDTWPLLRSVV